VKKVEEKVGQKEYISHLKIHLKLNYKDDLREIQVPKSEMTLERLYTEIKRIYGIDSNPIIRFHNSANELQTVVSEDDLRKAVNDFKVNMLYLSVS
jgi:hypothetical protein